MRPARAPISRRRLESLIALLGCAWSCASAQSSARTTRASAHAWLDATADVWLTRELGIQAEGKMERSRFAAGPQLVELRLGLEHPLGSATIAAGAMLLHTSPYGPFPAASPAGERRLWQQLAVEQRVGRLALSHRYRLEERWLERPRTADMSSAPYDFRLRMRYQARGTVPLGPRAAPHTPFAIVYDEVFVALGPHNGLNLLDQNRLGLGLGAPLMPKLRVEADYVNQLVLRADGRQVENNHTLQLALSVTRGTPHR